jgi:hypothetical protein
MAERKSSTPGGVSPGNAANEGADFGRSGAASMSGTSGTRGSSASASGEFRDAGSSQSRSMGEQQDSSGIVDRVKERAAAQISTQKDRATDGLGSVAQAVRQSTQQLRDQRHETVASYVEQAADQIERLSRRLKEKDVGELVEDAQRLARRQPALFVGSAFALGLVGARFFKSTSPNSDDDRYGSYGGGYGGGRGAYGGGYPAGSYGRTSSAGSEYRGTIPSSGAGTSSTTPRSTSTSTSTSGSPGSTGYRSSDTEKF